MVEKKSLREFGEYVFHVVFPEFLNSGQRAGRGSHAVLGFAGIGDTICVK